MVHDAKIAIIFIKDFITVNKRVQNISFRQQPFKTLRDNHTKIHTRNIKLYTRRVYVYHNVCQTNYTPEMIIPLTENKRRAKTKNKNKHKKK